MRKPVRGSWDQGKRGPMPWRSSAGARWIMGALVLVVSALAGGAIAWPFTVPPAQLADVAHGQPATPGTNAPPTTSGQPTASGQPATPATGAQSETSTAPATPVTPASPSRGVTVTIGPGA